MDNPTRIPISVIREQSPISRPTEVAAIVKEFLPVNGREAFIVLYLDTRHRLLSQPYIASIGTLNSCPVHPREVFKPAILLSAAAIIVAHNHPSGDCKPSGDDLKLTKRLSEAGTLLGISLLDHLVVADESEEYISIRESGWPE